MKLLCLGDFGIAGNQLSPLEISPPLGLLPGDEVMILFNWELPIGTELNPTPRVRGPRLVALPESPGYIKQWAPGIATLANNHILDAANEGLQNTIDALNEIGIKTVGAGTSPNEITKPLIWETEKGSVGIINWVFADTHPDWGAVPGPNCWPGAPEARNQIQTLKKETDWVLIVVHWSDEHFPYPRVEDRIIAQEIVQAGADIIIGHHPHVVRGMEIIGSSPVFYSLGNFFFSFDSDYTRSGISIKAPRHREALGVQVTFERGKKPAFRPFSFWMKRQSADLDPLKRAVRRMKAVSRPLQQYHNSEYARWYNAKRSRFDKWGAYLHFGLWKLTPGKIKKKVLGFIR